MDPMTQSLMELCPLRYASGQDQLFYGGHRFPDERFITTEASFEALSLGDPSPKLAMFLIALL